jgi:hypothetical protein
MMMIEWRDSKKSKVRKKKERKRERERDGQVFIWKKTHVVISKTTPG